MNSFIIIAGIIILVLAIFAIFTTFVALGKMMVSVRKKDNKCDHDFELDHIVYFDHSRHYHCTKCKAILVMEEGE